MPTDPATTARVAGALRGMGLTVAVGAVAEAAGMTVVSAVMAEDGRLRLADGRSLTADELARELR